MGGTIRLDYCDVEVFVDVDGEAVAAEVVDDDNQSLGITAPKSRGQLFITRGRAALTHC